MDSYTQGGSQPMDFELHSASFLSEQKVVYNCSIVRFKPETFIRTLANGTVFEAEEGRIEVQCKDKLKSAYSFSLVPEGRDRLLHFTSPDKDRISSTLTPYARYINVTGLPGFELDSSSPPTWKNYQDVLWIRQAINLETCGVPYRVPKSRRELFLLVVEFDGTTYVSSPTEFLRKKHVEQPVAPPVASGIDANGADVTPMLQDDIEHSVPAATTFAVVTNLSARFEVVSGLCVVHVPGATEWLFSRLAPALPPQDMSAAARSGAGIVNVEHRGDAERRWLRSIHRSGSFWIAVCIKDVVWATYEMVVENGVIRAAAEPSSDTEESDDDSFATPSTTSTDRSERAASPNSENLESQASIVSVDSDSDVERTCGQEHDGDASLAHHVDNNETVEYRRDEDDTSVSTFSHTCLASLCVEVGTGTDSKSSGEISSDELAVVLAVSAYCAEDTSCGSVANDSVVPDNKTVLVEVTASETSLNTRKLQSGCDSSQAVHGVVGVTSECMRITARDGRYHIGPFGATSKGADNTRVLLAADKQGRQAGEERTKDAGLAFSLADGSSSTGVVAELGCSFSKLGRNVLVVDVNPTGGVVDFNKYIYGASADANIQPSGYLPATTYARTSEHDPTRISPMSLVAPNVVGSSRRTFNSKLPSTISTRGFTYESVMKQFDPLSIRETIRNPSDGTDGDVFYLERLRRMTSNPSTRREDASDMEDCSDIELDSVNHLFAVKYYSRHPAQMEHMLDFWLSRMEFASSASAVLGPARSEPANSDSVVAATLKRLMLEARIRRQTLVLGATLAPDLPLTSDDFPDPWGRDIPGQTWVKFEPPHYKLAADPALAADVKRLRRLASTLCAAAAARTRALIFSPEAITAFVAHRTVQPRPATAARDSDQGIHLRRLLVSSAEHELVAFFSAFATAVPSTSEVLSTFTRPSPLWASSAGQALAPEDDVEAAPDTGGLETSAERFASPPSVSEEASIDSGPTAPTSPPPLRASSAAQAARSSESACQVIEDAVVAKPAGATPHLAGDQGRPNNHCPHA